MKDIYKQFGIYRITDKLTGMTYVGQTSYNFGDRWDNHRSLLNGNKHGNHGLQDAWNADGGQDNFEFAIIVSCDTPDVLDELEEKYIAMYRELGLSLNVADGGRHGLRGHHLSDETKRKIGAKNKVNMTGRKDSEQTRARKSEAQIRRFEQMSSDEYAAFCRVVSEKSRGYTFGDAYRQGCSERQWETPHGAKLTADQVRNIRNEYASGADKHTLAAEYGTSPANIMNIVKYRRWKHI